MSDLASLFCRVFFGLTMLVAHGLPKLSRDASSFPDPLGVGSDVSYWLTIFAEVVCAGLFAAGLFSRLFAIPLMVTMLVAAFIVHGADPFGKKEMALLFFAGYFTIFLSGGGQYSIQQILGVSSHKRLLRFLLK